MEFPASVTVGYEDIAVTGQGVVALNPPFVEASQAIATLALVQCQKATTRVRIDGGDPTSSSGFMLRAGEAMTFTNEAVSKARFLADTNTAALLSVTYHQ